MKAPNVFISVLPILLIAVAGQANLIFGQESIPWSRLSFDEGRLLIDVPKQALVLNESDRISLFFASEEYSDKLECEFRNGKDLLKLFRRPDGTKAKYEGLDFQGFRIVRAYETVSNGYSESVQLGSNKVLCRLYVRGSGPSEPRLRRVLDSIRLKSKPLFEPNSLTGNELVEKVDAASLKSSPEVEKAIEVPDAPKSVVRLERLQSSKKGNSNSSASPPKSPTFSRPLIILRTPTINYGELYRLFNSVGKVVARVRFRADGTIGEIIVDGGFTTGLATNIGDVIRQYKFLPAQIDGKPVDSTRYFHFDFDVRF